jgi:methionyl-tRNA formyltransferase
MKVAFFGYDFFADCLSAAEAAGHEVIAVFSNPCDNARYDFNRRVKAYAKRRKIPFTERKPRDRDVLRLTTRGCDLLLVAAYAHKVPLPTGAPLGLNVHPSLLPVGRGRWPLPWIILEELEFSGVTIHKLVEELDAGDIVWQESFKIAATETLESLSARTQMLARRGTEEVLRSFDEQMRRARPQGEGVTWDMPPDQLRTLTWTDRTSDIARTARAFGKFGSYAVFDEKEWLVQDVTVWTEDHDFVPGTVVHRTSLEVVIAALDGFVCLRYFEIDPDFVTKGASHD